MLVNLFWKTLRDQKWSLLGWSLGLAALSLYLLYVYPFINRAAAMMKVLDSLPPVIKNLIGKNNFMATPEGFFNLQPFSILAPLLFIVFAVAKGSDATAGEEERGTLDLLLANPLRRTQVVLHKSLAHGAALLLLSVVFWVGMAAGTWLFGIALNRLRLAAVIFSCWLLGLVFLRVRPGLRLLERQKEIQHRRQRRPGGGHLPDQRLRAHGGELAAVPGPVALLFLQRQQCPGQRHAVEPMSWCWRDWPPFSSPPRFSSSAAATSRPDPPAVPPLPIFAGRWPGRISPAWEW